MKFLSSIKHKQAKYKTKGIFENILFSTVGETYDSFKRFFAKSCWNKVALGATGLRDIFRKGNGIEKECNLDWRR